MLPTMVVRWSLSNTEAGWITATFYGAYMLAVPILVTLTDRLPAKYVYLFGVGCTVAGYGLFGLLADGFWSALALRALAGIGWAGSYMTGLKLLADQVDARLMSRAVTGHVASLGVSGAISYLLADLLDGWFGWRIAFAIVAGAALLAWFLVALLVAVPVAVPAASAHTVEHAARQPQGERRPANVLFDFRPVFRNRAAMSYSIAYCIHTLEMNALRGWGVAFLAYVATRSGDSVPSLSPTVVLAAIGLIGTLASVFGNEAAIRWGRRRLVMTAMAASLVFSSITGYLGALSYPLATALMTLWAIAIWLDSASLTAGTAAAAEPARRGATLAIHSMLGYAGGFVGPLMIGLILDRMGGMSPLSWGASFLSLAVMMLFCMVVFWRLRPLHADSA
jgi:predicted MFS family arabinose efflux permease